MKNKILQWILILFFLPADILYFMSRNRKCIDCDLESLMDEIPYRTVGIPALNYALLINKPFRNIFYYRTSSSFLLRNISRIFIRPLSTIEIMGDIEEGFRISHNYAVIHPQSAGKNLFVGHGATIGKGKASEDDPDRVYPIIGDHVSIYANAIVFGGIKIGNDVRIGAGAVVNKDVPDHCTVVGNPAIYLKHGTNKEDIEYSS